MACVRSNTPTGVSLSAAAINFIPELIGITPQGAHTLEKETCEIVMPRQESQTPSQNAAAWPVSSAQGGGSLRSAT